MKPMDVTPWEEGLLSEERLRKTLRLFLILGVVGLIRPIEGSISGMRTTW